MQKVREAYGDIESGRKNVDRDSFAMEIYNTKLESLIESFDQLYGDSVFSMTPLLRQTLDQTLVNRLDLRYNHRESSLEEEVINFWKFVKTYSLDVTNRNVADTIHIDLMSPYQWLWDRYPDAVQNTCNLSAEQAATIQAQIDDAGDQGTTNVSIVLPFRAVYARNTVGGIGIYDINGKRYLTYNDGLQ